MMKPRTRVQSQVEGGRGSATAAAARGRADGYDTVRSPAASARIVAARHRYRVPEPWSCLKGDNVSLNALDYEQGIVLIWQTLDR